MDLIIDFDFIYNYYNKEFIKNFYIKFLILEVFILLIAVSYNNNFCISIIKFKEMLLILILIGIIY